jgi:hypothetical protein
MNLQEHIRRILKEENEVRGVHAIKTLSDLLLKDTEMYCGVKIMPPSKTFNKMYYQVKLYFIGGVNTKYWPRTQAIINNELDILLKVHTILKTTLPYNIAIDMKYIKATLLSIFVGSLLTLIPILVKIFLYIRNLVSN